MIRVLGIAKKTELLLQRDGKGYRELGEWRGVKHTAVWQFVNKKAETATWLPTTGDGMASWCDVDCSILDEICTFFGVPREWFTQFFTSEEFEREIRTPLWSRLLNLTAPDPDSRVAILGPSNAQKEEDWKLRAAPETGRLSSNRFEYSDEKPTRPALMSLAPGDEFYLQLTGWENWQVILLLRKPTGRVECLLPNPRRQIPNTFGSEGTLRVPAQSGIHLVVAEDDDPGIYTILAIFHEKPYLDQVVPTTQFIEQLSSNASESLREATVRQLIHWLEDKKNRQEKPPSFEIVSKEFHVRGR